MKSLKKFALSAVMAGASLALFSCGAGSETALNGSENIGTASLKIGVKFPDSEGITPQFISQQVQCIKVVYTKGSLTKSITLTPSNPTGTIDNIIPGPAYINVYATDVSDGNDCIGTTLDTANIYANIKEGTNNLTATLISPAKWKFVDNNDNPAPIVLNKTNPSSSETIDSFNVVLPDYMIPSSIDTSKPTGVSTYKVAFSGSNLTPYTDNDNPESKCVSDSLCITKGNYYIQFIGPSTTNNAFETSDIQLAPVTIGNDIQKRFFFIYGTPPGYEPMSNDMFTKTFKATQPDNTNVIDDFNSRFSSTSVVSANTMNGVILEVLQKSSNDQVICSFDENGDNAFTCPNSLADLLQANNIGPSSIRVVSLGDIISSQSIDNDNCYKGTTIVEDRKIDYLHLPFKRCIPTTPYYCDYNLDGDINDNDDINGDNDVNQNDNYYVILRKIMNTDICVHPFRAKAEEIPPNELNMIVQ